MNHHHPTFPLFTFRFSLFTFHPSTFFKVLLTLFTIHFSLFTFHSSLFAKALTPSQIRHNGLTDEQIDDIFAAESNATLRLSRAHWRNIEYRLHRFDNMRGWLNEQDEGRLGDHILAVTDTNLVVIASNGVLRAKCVDLAEEANYYYASFTNQLAQTAALSNLYVIVSAQATAAQAKITDEIADLQAKIETYKEYQTKYPLLKKIFAAMITDAENRIKILQALTGGAS